MTAIAVKTAVTGVMPLGAAAQGAAFTEENGADPGSRTRNLRFTKPLLCQLS
jgi:hypothetical protein